MKRMLGNKTSLSSFWEKKKRSLVLRGFSSSVPARRQTVPIVKSRRKRREGPRTTVTGAKFTNVHTHTRYPRNGADSQHENTLESCSSRLAALNTVMGEMILKVGIALTIALALGHRSRAGVISLEGEEAYQEEAFHGQGGSLASSYVQFHGPVEGPEYEVKVPRAAEYNRHDDDNDDANHLHEQEQQPRHEYTVDYVAHPKYEFSYGVEDRHTGDYHNQKETRDGNSVSGEYSVKEPGGNVRVVRYRADKDGFHAVVHTSGENDRTNLDVYGGQGQVHDHRHQTQREQDVADYTLYANEEGY
ncbi:uncharacterized protein LOC143149698 [Ptiloglossa arizonensis]|uniref:uncharacterized protein LOC143149698 n=1 Tax=Ptiloglossa arizonensis TaxID=3350558 RepID=UPI003FA14BA5